MTTANYSEEKLLRLIRACLLFFMVALILSGLTAFPIETELSWLLRTFSGYADFTIYKKLSQFYEGVAYTNAHYPFVMYGCDWLAFAHIVIALVFIGPIKNPVRNIWVLEWGMLACVAIFPLAFIAGPVRGMPFYWQLIDCSFGVCGLLPLWFCRKLILQLKTINTKQ